MDKIAQYTLVEAMFSETTVLEKVYVHTPESEVGIALSKADLQYYLCWKRGGTEPSVVDSRDAVAAHGVMSWYYSELP